MLTYITRRVLYSIPVVLIASFLLFAFVRFQVFKAFSESCYSLFECFGIRLVYLASTSLLQPPHFFLYARVLNARPYSKSLLLF